MHSYTALHHDRAACCMVTLNVTMYPTTNFANVRFPLITKKKVHATKTKKEKVVRTINKSSLSLSDQSKLLAGLPVFTFTH